MAYIGSRLRPQINSTGAYVYREGEEITNFIIVTKGLAAFVQANHNDAIFAVIDPKGNGNTLIDGEEVDVGGKRVLKHLGYEDSVVNHL